MPEADRFDGPIEGLLAEIADLPQGDDRRQSVLEEVVRRHGTLAGWAAHRYADRGEDFDVLQQVGYVGLMEAVQRFDPHKGAFVPFARTTIVGLIRRHFRDRRRWIQLPRHLQDLQDELRRNRDEISQRLGHEATSHELAAALGVDAGVVAEADSATFRPLSLDVPTSGESEAPLAEQLGIEDAGIDRVIDLKAVHAAMTDLPLRERKILLLRFYGNHTQTEIGNQLGMSQMQISRAIARACAQLRERILEELPAKPGPCGTTG